MPEQFPVLQHQQLSENGHIAITVVFQPDGAQFQAQCVHSGMPEGWETVLDVLLATTSQVRKMQRAQAIQNANGRIEIFPALPHSLTQH